MSSKINSIMAKTAVEREKIGDKSPGNRSTPTSHTQLRQGTKSATSALRRFSETMCVETGAVAAGRNARPDPKIEASMSGGKRTSETSWKPTYSILTFLRQSLVGLHIFFFLFFVFLVFWFF